MKRHRDFEFYASSYLNEKGYTTEVTPGVADWGVDIFCEKDSKKYVVQVKMYGDCKTKVNRQMMMELYGVMHYFDCQGAIMIYNGKIMPDAQKVANKLGIQMIYLNQNQMDALFSDEFIEEASLSFYTIWEEVRQLRGCQIRNSRGTQYTIIEVTDGDITYTNQTGKLHREKIDLFRRIYAYILYNGEVEQSQLRGLFNTLSSAFISTVFANLSSCEVTPNPYTIKLKNDKIH